MLMHALQWIGVFLAFVCGAVVAERVDYRTMVEKDFLGTWDFPKGPDGRTREATVEIAGVERFRPGRVRKVRGPDGKMVPERNKRIVISFVGKRKRWLAGPVSQEALAAMFGPIVQDWVSKRITLWADHDVMFGKRRVGGVRVRPMAATGPVTEDALDQPVDEERSEELAEIFGDEEPLPPEPETAPAPPAPKGRA